MFIDLLDKTLNETGFWNDLGRLHNEFSKGLIQNNTQPAINYYINEDGAAIYCLVPGFAEDEIEISINDKKLEITGKREKDPVAEGTKTVLNEVQGNEFARIIELPFRVEADKVEATCKNGILAINLPKAESEKPKKIKVN